MEVKYPVVADKVMQPVGIATESINLYGNQEKKRRLTSEQLESLERSFQEEIKLEPERKMKLARELELQPRQVAVWFQNRRARWKAKQLESLYDKLKLDYDAVYKEKQKLQDEVSVSASKISLSLSLFYHAAHAQMIVSISHIFLFNFFFFFSNDTRNALEKGAAIPFSITTELKYVILLPCNVCTFLNVSFCVYI